MFEFPRYVDSDDEENEYENKWLNRYMKKPIKFTEDEDEEKEEEGNEEEEQYISDFPFSFSEIYYEKEINKLEPNNFSLSESKEKEQIKTLSIQASNKKEPTRFEDVNPPKPSIASSVTRGTDLYQNCSKFISGRTSTLKTNKYFTNCQRCKIKIIENAKLYCNLCCEIKNFQTRFMRPRCFEPTLECNKEVV